MIQLLDGPAAGVILHLKRTPILLRVVEAPDGKFDALDQLEDVPADDEKIYVYRFKRDAGIVHVDSVDKRGRRVGKWMTTFEYEAPPEQPSDEQVRTTEAWRAWAQAWAQAEGIKVEGSTKDGE